MSLLSPVICWVLMRGCTDGPAGPVSAEAKAVAFLSNEVPRGRVRTVATLVTITEMRPGHSIKRHEPVSRCRRTRWRKPLAGWSGRRTGSITAVKGHSATSGWPAWFSRRPSILPSRPGGSKTGLPWCELPRFWLDQATDGSWPLEGEDVTGSPATYGRSLATLLARGFLCSADAARFRTAIDRATAGFQPGNLNHHRRLSLPDG